MPILIILLGKNWVFQHKHKEIHRRIRLESIKGISFKSRRECSYRLMLKRSSMKIWRFDLIVVFGTTHRKTIWYGLYRPKVQDGRRLQRKIKILSMLYW